MRVNAARDVEARAWPRSNPPSVQIKIGVIRVTASPDEAIKLARELTDAADEATRP